MTYQETIAVIPDGTMTINEHGWLVFVNDQGTRVADSLLEEISHTYGIESIHANLFVNGQHRDRSRLTGAYGSNERSIVINEQLTYLVSGNNVTECSLVLVATKEVEPPKLLEPLPSIGSTGASRSTASEK